MAKLSLAERDAAWRAGQEAAARYGARLSLMYTDRNLAGGALVATIVFANGRDVDIPVWPDKPVAA